MSIAAQRFNAQVVKHVKDVFFVIASFLSLGRYNLSVVDLFLSSGTPEKWFAVPKGFRVGIAFPKTASPLHPREEI